MDLRASKPGASAEGGTAPAVLVFGSLRKRASFLAASVSLKGLVRFRLLQQNRSGDCSFAVGFWKAALTVPVGPVQLEGHPVLK